MHASPVTQRFRRRQQRELHVHMPGGVKSRGWGQHHAACEILRRNACDIQCRALARNRLLGRLSMHLYAANAHALALRKNF